MQQRQRCASAWSDPPWSLEGFSPLSRGRRAASKRFEAPACHGSVINDGGDGDILQPDAKRLEQGDRVRAARGPWIGDEFGQRSHFRPVELSSLVEVDELRCFG